MAWRRKNEDSVGSWPVGDCRSRDSLRIFYTAGGRYWDRTSDLFRVKEARYPCANRPAGSILPQEIRSQGAGGYSLCPSTHPVGVCAGLRSSARVSPHTKLCACGCGAVVAHHLAKVRVASSNLVIRSVKPRGGALPLWWCGREARQRPAKPFTRVRIPSPPRLENLILGDWRSGSALP